MATLLVVDDEKIVRETLQQVFSQRYQCDIAESAEKALEYVELRKYDVVITDTFMLGMSELEMLKRVKKRRPGTPVIVMSARGEEFRELLMEMGAFAFLTKPFPLEELEFAVSRAIAKREPVMALSLKTSDR